MTTFDDLRTTEGSDMQVWRIHIKPDADPAYAFDVCKKQGVVGVGWQVEKKHRDPFDLDTYLDVAKQTYVEHWKSCKSAVTLLAKMACGDLVWTRDASGMYWLARVRGPWEYRDRPDNRRADITNVRPVDLVRIGDVSCVPGKVIASMRSSRTVQRIQGDTIKIYSTYAYAKAKGKPLPKIGTLDIFELISSQDCEDIIFVLLQRRGWVVFPARRLADTMSYEYVLRNIVNGEPAVVQVKTGSACIDFRILPKGVRAFVFHPNDMFEGQPTEHTTVLEREEVVSFMRENRMILPPVVTGWMNLAGL